MFLGLHHDWNGVDVVGSSCFSRHVLHLVVRSRSRCHPILCGVWCVLAVFCGKISISRGVSRWLYLGLKHLKRAHHLDDDDDDCDGVLSVVVVVVVHVYFRVFLENSCYVGEVREKGSSDSSLSGFVCLCKCSLFTTDC